MFLHNTASLMHDTVSEVGSDLQDGILHDSRNPQSSKGNTFLLKFLFIFNVVFFKSTTFL